MPIIDISIKDKIAMRRRIVLCVRPQAHSYCHAYYTMLRDGGSNAKF